VMEDSLVLNCVDCGTVTAFDCAQCGKSLCLDCRKRCVLCNDRSCVGCTGSWVDGKRMCRSCMAEKVLTGEYWHT
jgi:hypothetical protein